MQAGGILHKEAIPVSQKTNNATAPPGNHGIDSLII
jgi:hypothetical protein